jgi:hypothetical protein
MGEFIKWRVAPKMSDAPDNFNQTSKQEKNMRTIRIIWIILIAFFSLIILLRVYNWSKGQDDFRGILSPLGMIFLGFSQIVGRENKPLYYIFLGIAMVLVFGGLLLLFIN